MRLTTRQRIKYPLSAYTSVPLPQAVTLFSLSTLTPQVFNFLGMEQKKAQYLIRQSPAADPSEFPR